MDDSKWLLSPKHDAEFKAFFDPVSYFFVLFDFEDLDDPTLINARIWEVDARHPGFVYCMIDYYINIKTKSASAAPFNLWPFSLKFQLMEPKLIYHSQIDSSNHIHTLIFPELRGASVVAPLDPLHSFGGARGFTLGMARVVGEKFGVTLPGDATKRELLEMLQIAREEAAWGSHDLVITIVDAMYGDRIAEAAHWIPLDR